MLDPVLLGYMGGIIDGEGCIAICKSSRTRLTNKNPAYSIRVSVSMCDKEIPELFSNTFGGSVQKRRRTLDLKHKESYEWIITTQKAKDFLEVILPYLRIPRKVETAKLCIQLQESIIEKNLRYKRLTADDLEFRDSLYSQTRKLNHRGGVYAI